MRRGAGALVTGVAVLGVATTGLAAVGVDLPEPLTAPFEAVGVSLPNQDDEGRAAPSDDQTPALTGIEGGGSEDDATRERGGSGEAKAKGRHAAQGRAVGRDSGRKQLGEHPEQSRRGDTPAPDVGEDHGRRPGGSNGGENPPGRRDDPPVAAPGQGGDPPGAANGRPGDDTPGATPGADGQGNGPDNKPETPEPPTGGSPSSDRPRPQDERPQDPQDGRPQNPQDDRPSANRPPSDAPAVPPAPGTSKRPESAE